MNRRNRCWLSHFQVRLWLFQVLLRLINSCRNETIVQNKFGIDITFIEWRCNKGLIHSLVNVSILGRNLFEFHKVLLDFNALYSTLGFINRVIYNIEMKSLILILNSSSPYRVEILNLWMASCIVAIRIVIVKLGRVLVIYCVSAIDCSLWIFNLLGLVYSGNSVILNSTIRNFVFSIWPWNWNPTRIVTHLCVRNLRIHNDVVVAVRHRVIDEAWIVGITWTFLPFESFDSYLQVWCSLLLLRAQKCSSAVALNACMRDILDTSSYFCYILRCKVVISSKFLVHLRRFGYLLMTSHLG